MKTKAFITFISLFFLSVCACEDSFFIQDMKYPNGSCTIPSERDAPFYVEGTWDIGISYAYHVHPLLVADTKDLEIDGAWVSILDTEENTLFDEYYVHAPCSILPETRTAGMSFEAINSELYDSIAGLWGDFMGLFTIDELCEHQVRSKILLKIRVEGSSYYGDVETPHFLFPVTVCCGCLVFYPVEAWDELAGNYDCAEVSRGWDDYPCFLGQDRKVDCSMCFGTIPELCDPQSEEFINPWF